MGGRRDKNESPDTLAPLLVVAGVPQALTQAVIDTIQKRHPPWRVVSRPFPERDVGFYDDDPPIVELMRATFEFAKNHRSPGGDAVPEPNRLVLAYVDDGGAWRLLDAFGHSALPFRMDDELWEWPKGRHWRHHPETVIELVEKAIAHATTQASLDLHLRLQRREPQDALLLPARNYHLGGGRLAERYQAWLSEAITVTDIEAVVQSRKYRWEELQAFYKRTGGRNKKFAHDDRGLVFAKSEFGQHGFVWALPQGVTLDIATVRRALESLFRFGTPIPEGFQHDVQWADGVPLNNQLFDCEHNGPTTFSGSHANVYPNDVVR